MNRVSPLREFEYGEDRVVVADMANRDKGYLHLMRLKINEIISSLDSLLVHQTTQDKEFEKRVLKAEKEAADKIVNAAKKGDGDNVKKDSN